jgi:hypothetical protein
VDVAVNATVNEAVSEAVDVAVYRAVSEAMREGWYRYIGGQFWPGGWHWGGAWTSFFREVCDLELPGDLWDHARAYEGTIESACWWWPHTHFVMVCNRPQEIHREQVAPKGWSSHRLHREDGPAVRFADGWSMWAIHGVRVTEQIVMAPETLTVEQIDAEQNAEVKRVMLERFGFDRWVRDKGARERGRDTDSIGKERILWEAPGETEDEPLVVVQVTNSTPEPDGEHKSYWLRVPPETRTPAEAVAWTWGVDPATYERELVAET